MSLRRAQNIFMPKNINSITIIITLARPAILGRNWFSVVKLNWKELFNVSSRDFIGELSARYKNVFGPGLGKIKDFKARLCVHSEATPKFHKSRPKPYSLRKAVEAELDRLEKEGVVTKVSHSAWAAPVVVVPKADDGIRLCGDFKVTVNQVLDVDKYPLPNPQDLLSALAGGKRFMKLDLKHAYQQLPLSEEPKQFLNINTSKGLYQYQHLPFGVASAPAIFQSTMDTILKSIAGVVRYINDIVITGRSDQEHRNRLEAVLSSLERYGVHLKWSKCSFLQEKVQFLGHVIDAEGVHLSPEKVQPIVEAPTPATVTELQSFLGMLQYYGKFLPGSQGVKGLLSLRRSSYSLRRFWLTMMLTFLFNWLVMPLHMVSERCYHMSCQVGKSALLPLPQEH